MFQSFHENTQISKLVKNILATEPIPLLQTVREGFPLIKGCKYIYKNRPIVCTNTGNLTNGNIHTTGSDVTLTTHNSTVSWYDSDTHRYLGNYLRYLRDAKSIDLMRYYNCYNAIELTDIYLDTSVAQPLFCSSDMITVDDILQYKVLPSDTLCCGSTSGYTEGGSCNFGLLNDYKVVAVPIRFDTTYTVAIESSTSVSMRSIIYNQGMVKEYRSSNSETKYYSDYLDYTARIIPFARFNSPFTYRVDLATRTGMDENLRYELYTRQKDLYLVLQIPRSSTSSIVVLEGTYLNRYKYVTQGNVVSVPENYNKDAEAIADDTVLDDRILYATSSNIYNHYNLQKYQLEKTYRKSYIPENKNSNSKQEIVYPDNLSLLYYNTGVSYAFSDRLVEYLLLNVVTPYETLLTNVSRVQSSLGELYKSYRTALDIKNVTYGIWDDNIQKYVLDVVDKNPDLTDFSFDHDGYINKDVESILSQRGVYTT